MIVRKSSDLKRNVVNLCTFVLYTNLIPWLKLDQCKPWDPTGIAIECALIKTISL